MSGLSNCMEGSIVPRLNGSIPVSLILLHRQMVPLQGLPLHAYSKTGLLE